MSELSATQRKRLRRLNKKARPIANRGGVSPLLGTMLMKRAMSQPNPGPTIAEQPNGDLDVTLSPIATALTQGE